MRRAFWMLGWFTLLLASCTPAAPQGTVTARSNGVLLSVMLPGWSFVKYTEDDRLYQYRKGEQQLFIAVSKYNRQDHQSPHEDLVKNALLDLCPGQTCTPVQPRPEYWLTHYSSGVTGAVIHNWDVARLTPKGEMLLSILRLVAGTPAGEIEIARAIDTSLKLERE